MNHSPASPRIARPALLACAAIFLAGCPLGRTPVVLADSPSLPLPWSVALLASALACGLVCVVQDDSPAAVALRGTRHTAALLCAYGAGVLLTMFAASGMVPTAVAVCGGILTGATCVPLLALLARTLAQPSLRANMAAAATVFGGAVALLWLVGTLDIGFLGFATLSAAGIAGYAVIASQLCTAGDTPTEAPADPAGLRGFLGMALLSLGWVFIFAFFIKSGFGGGVERPLLWGVDKELFLFICAAVGLGAIGTLVRSAPLSTTVNRLVTPLLVVLVLVAQSFPAMSAVHAAGVAFVVFTTAGAALFGVAVVTTLGATGEATFWRTVGALCATYAVGRLCGLAFDCSLPVDQNASASYNTAMTILLSVMLVIGIVDSWRASLPQAPRDPSSDDRTATELLMASCHEITQTYRLTPRESEVLGYLVRGYTSTVIANELVISENTVRTHMKGIYRKLGVSSRAELLAVVEAMPSPAAARR